MKKTILTSLLFAAVLMLCGQNPKYVFLFIGDGMAVSQRTVAEKFSLKSGRGPLAINNMKYKALTKTSSASHLVTDSAAAATAIACGEKTVNYRVGMDASGKRKLESVAKIAKRKGKKVGIITSVTLNHATPAGFYANVLNRNMYYEIGLDLIASGFDYFGGGGLSKYNDKKSPLYKGDLYTLASESGYKVVRKSAEIRALKPGNGKVLAIASSGALPYAIDRQNNKKVVSLAELTAKGIELLMNPKGFFMMVEGGAIDWCGHGNEMAGNVREVIDLDDAVKVALAFAEKYPSETLVVVTGDHETGGLTMGFSGTGYGMYMERLALQKKSMWAFGSILKRVQKKAQKEKKTFTFEDAKKLLTANFGFRFSGDPGKDPMVLSEIEVKTLREAFTGNLLPIAARILVSKKAGVSWSTTKHTAQPVLTTASGVKGELFNAPMENTDIARKLKSIL